jgi:hypothetical protein
MAPYLARYAAPYKVRYIASSQQQAVQVVAVAIPVPPESAEMRYIASRFGLFDHPSVRLVGFVLLPLPLEML